jgi:hypothetical protein
MSSSPREWHGNGDEDVATPLPAGAVLESAAWGHAAYTRQL